MKKSIFSFLFWIIGVQAMAQQDALYSQYMQNPLTINPAYTGIYNMFSATAISRWQWVGMQGAPQTNILTAHSAIANNKLGVGGIVLNDRFGVSSNTEFHGTVAYKLRLSDNEEEVLSFGMQAGVINYNFNYADLRQKDPDDPNFANTRLSATQPNFGAGVFYKNEKWYAGLSVPKLLNSTFDDGQTAGTDYRRHFFLTGGYLIDLTSVQVKPSFLLKYVQGAPVSVDANLSVLLKDILWLGASFRYLNSAVFMAQVQITDMLRLGYALDIPATSVIKTSYGSHELMLNIDLKLLKSHDIGLRYF
jgi:type IX secretion system PorP/SprF family membrane protein